jgi:GNAT superfamily N-acetyltransferase
MNKYYGVTLIIAITLVLFAQIISGAEFVTQVAEKGFLHTTQKITCYNGGEAIGYIYYEHLPLSFFVIHSFFIRRHNRCQGHGAALLEFTCHKLKEMKARNIFIQPGSFEHDDNGMLIIVPREERAERLAAIIRLYERVGFHFAPRILSFCARYLYKLMGIDEDARYLMVL